jgi:hypothetical protein
MKKIQYVYTMQYYSTFKWEKIQGHVQWSMPVIPATQEVKIRRIALIIQWGHRLQSTAVRDGEF